MTITAKQQRLLSYNTILTRHKKHLKPGNSFTREQFMSMFGIVAKPKNKTYQEVHKANLKLIAAQSEINILMRENGMYLKSQDYYTSFVVASKQQAKDTIVRYSRAVDAVSHCTERMYQSTENRLKTATWGHYKKLSGDRIANLMCAPSERHTSLEKRVKKL